MPSVVTADVHERPSGVPDLLCEAGMHVEFRPLGAGDYAFGDRLLVERKTVYGLHQGVVEGRLWSQIGRLRAAARRAFLLVEGGSLDAGPLPPAAVRGVCLAVIEQGVPVIRSDDATDSVRWLIRLDALRSRNRRRPRPVYDQRPARRDDVPAAVLAGVPGISVITARSLLERFGSVAEIACA